MESLIKEFLTIWINNCNNINVNNIKFNIFIKVINKLKKNLEIKDLEIKDLEILIELINIIADNISNKYGFDYYQQTKIYEESELNCCSSLLNILESEFYWALENKYDNAIQNNFKLK